ncbi:pantoate--beta-alanine ligase [Candidatus Chlorohelix sp.]|uniref:pantoate--beta-alanine ligase n=1 Tax=Candidatus Chlorohelix sp. TaxID=3139201 RepID=UPI0030352223
MELISSITEMARITANWRNADLQVGLAPTMGYLHEGHLSLTNRAKMENDKVVASIFVNPLQFGPKEDFSRYPRDLEKDLMLLESAGVDAVFHPTSQEMYPENFNASVEVLGITDVLEGAQRPGHFKGVTTVVAKLFNIVSPHRAYFGQKDAQQVAVIKKMVRDLNFPLEIIICPTLREADGLAMSSRNVYLNADERKAATVLYHALATAKAAFENGSRQGNALRKIMDAVISSEPLAKTDYVSAANPENLREYDGLIPTGYGVLLSMAVRFGSTRLIDNFQL